MHRSFVSWVCCLAATSLAVAHVIPRHHSLNKMQALSIQMGWALQSSTCPTNSISCGSGSCCPSGLYCFPGANDEVASCCPTVDTACRGMIEGAPICADPSWSLWKGLEGNSFCCEVGLLGIYDYQNPVAGTCVSSAPAGASTAVLMSTGSGSPPISVPGPAQSSVAPVQPSVAPAQTTSSSATADGNGPKPTAASTTAPSAAPSAASNGTLGNPVFFHYLIGTITGAHCEQDVVDAQALGADGFALNLNTVTASWATTTVAQLFKSAAAHNFKLFFSFDMTGFNNPNQFTDFLTSYVTSPAYYQYKGLPFVSTFNGGDKQYTFGQSSVADGWKVALQQAMANSGHPIYFIPAFQDAPNGGTNFFTTYPTVDGAMNWNSWPVNTAGKIVVPTTDDQAYSSGAKAAGKTFMMGLSPLQFKHLDSGDNWYRRGEQNLEYRFGQILSIQPDFVEIQTWNDAGESHYMGNSWPEPIEGSGIENYTTDYDHTGYWQILPAFIKAYKAGATTTDAMFPTNGAKAQGTFWHHTLLTSADCSADSIGKPSGEDTIEDKVTVVVLAAADATDLKVDISSGGNHLGGTTLKPGYNEFSVSGLTAGIVTTTVTNAAGSTIVSGSGPLPVVSTAKLCNYNFQVVGLK